jgi:hypothetical protein
MAWSAVTITVFSTVLAMVAQLSANLPELNCTNSLR